MIHQMKNDMMSKRDMSRRRFLSHSVAAGTAISALGLGIAPAYTRPTRGGTLRMGTIHGQSTDTLDPALLFNGGQWNIAYGVRNTLTQIEAGSALAPCLATEWSPNANATVWTFALRQGVEFHDGKTLDVNDVIASINHHRGEDSKSGAKPIADQIDHVTADGAAHIVITLTRPNVDFPVSLASANFTICKATDTGIDANSGVGTGGYILREWEPGVHAYLERNPNYWRDDRAHFEQIEMITINDSTSRMSALLSNGVDVIDDVEFKLVNQLAAQSGITVEKTQGPLHYLFSMMGNTAPFDDKNVRLALKYAVDREDLIDKILLGNGTVGNDHPIGPSYLHHDPTLEQRTYDPDRAKFHLREAGLDALRINVSASNAAYSGAVDAATLVLGSAAPAGIDVNIVREPADGYWTDVYMQRPMFANYWGGFTTASEMFSTGYVPGAAWNESHFENARFLELLEGSNGELDSTVRAEMLHEMQAIVRDEAGQLIWAFPDNILARNETIGHGELAHDRPTDGHHIFERWWATT